MSEFKAFALKGNVMDLAVGVIIGGAFQKIIDSLVGDVIAPLLLNPALKAAGVENLADWHPGGIFWGKFLAAVIAFLVIAFVLFMMIKGMNNLKKKEAEAPAAPPEDITLLREIRDALKK
jgi:large conductance mechanosensitive channel